MTESKRGRTRSSAAVRLKRADPNRVRRVNELRQLADRKAKVVRLLEGLLEVAESELVDLERQLGSIEDSLVDENQSQGSP